MCRRIQSGFLADLVSQFAENQSATALVAVAVKFARCRESFLVVSSAATAVEHPIPLPRLGRCRGWLAFYIEGVRLQAMALEGSRSW